jgi:hypothetical protein
MIIATSVQTHPLDRATAARADSLGQEGTPRETFGITYKFKDEFGPNNPLTANVTYSNVVALNKSCGRSIDRGTTQTRTL